MGQWIKTFTDNSELIGTDLAVDAGIISWSKTPINLLSALLEHDNFIMKIVGLGNYWQSDSYESVYPGPKATLIQRRIEKQIETSDNFIHILQNANTLQVFFNTKVTGGQFITIANSWIGQWLIVEYDLKLQVARYYIRSKRF